jgi:hypothetical protein
MEGFLTWLMLAGCYLLSSVLTTGLLCAILGAGVVAHIVGHYGFEHKPPALLSRPIAVLEAPVWLLATCAGLTAGQPNRPETNQE